MRNREFRGAKKVVIAFAMTPLFFLPSSVHADVRQGDQGFGVMLGNPSGFSWKMWLQEKVGLDAAVGVARSEFDVHITLLWHDFDTARRMSGLDGMTSRGDVPFYIGVGPRLLFESNTEFGIRIPLGVCYLPKTSQWETFLEVAPVIRLTPDAGLNGDFAIGLRYYFPAVRPRLKP